MKTLDTHKTNECNEAISITVDEPNAEYGNASHEYEIEWPDKEGHQNFLFVRFQRGPIKEVGVNGVTNEALLAIIIDRLEGFQLGGFACPENDKALGFARLTLDALKERTQKRLARGVEGTNTP
jgi:hypothetical protein